jgi:small subunit ribosomal protein S6
LREYETTFVVQPEISDEGTKAILGRLDGILAAGGATRLMCEDHGKRKLAFEIKKFHKGHYYTLMYLDGGKVVPEVERSLRLDESILRFLTIQAATDVTDIEARKATAAQAEVEQAKRAAERAAREAEEADARREAEAAGRSLGGDDDEFGEPTEDRDEFPRDSREDRASRFGPPDEDEEEGA